MSTSQISRQQLADAFVAELNRRDSAMPATLEFSHGDSQISCRLREIDRIACELDAIYLQIPALERLSTEKLASLSEELCGQLNYLLEPISPIELDSERSESQNSSNPPSYDSDRTRRYYELLVRRGEIDLVRYEKPVGQARQPISMKLTREVLFRLLADILQATVDAG